LLFGVLAAVLAFILLLVGAFVGDPSVKHSTSPQGFSDAVKSLAAAKPSPPFHHLQRPLGSLAKEECGDGGDLTAEECRLLQYFFSITNGLSSSPPQKQGCSQSCGITKKKGAASCMTDVWQMKGGKDQLSFTSLRYHLR
jgi:hypothetical protein